jgi:predicted GNAT superfamily acetyltransferase
MERPRVQKRLSAAAQEFRQLPPDAVPVVMAELGGRPAHGSLTGAIAAGKASLAIPADIVSLERRDRAIAWEWRLATRWGFTELLKAGFIVTDYCRGNAGTNDTGAYVLEAGSIERFLSAS